MHCKLGVQLALSYPLKCVLIALIVFVALSFVPLSVFAQDQSLGRVRVASFTGPEQVAPAGSFSMSLDVEYEVRTTVTIRAAIYPGSSNASAPLWQSGIVNVSGGGDKVWTVNFTAPTVEGTIQFSAYAYYLDNGVWTFYDDPTLGPGHSQITIKVSQYANLLVNMGVPGLVVTIGNASETTSQTGDFTVKLPVGVPYLLSAPSDLEFQNATRIVFNGWQDGSNQSARIIILSGDFGLIGSYRHQYLLKASSQPGSSYQKWCEIGSNVTLREADFAPNSSFLTAFGGKYVFSGWSGDVNSHSSEITLTMDSPKSVTATFSIEYGYLIIIIPIIIASGILGEVVLLSLKRRKRAQPGEPVHIPTCPNCGEVIEEGWAHCIHCGTDLTFPEGATVKQ
jgi:hypothetical protein